jgi:hydroxymethylbilane synthase
MNLRIGTRASALALWQAEHVKARLAGQGHDALLVPITTTGDRLLDRRLELVGGKGAFLKEIEEALLANEVDLAVHSLKDVPTVLPEGLRLVAFLERADPRDVLISRGDARLMDLPAAARVGTTSLRRQVQIRSLRPDVALLDLRGNVDTRIRKLREGQYDAIVLAHAGLTRLGRAGEASEILEPEVLLPAPGQGAIVIECRAGDARTAHAIAPLDHAPTARAVAAERAFLAALGGGCNVPLGAYAIESGDALWLRAFVARTDGSVFLRGEARGPDARSTGERLAGELLARGAGPLIHTP